MPPTLNRIFASDNTGGLAHALTIDVEGFAESHADSVRVDPALLDPARNDREIEENLAAVLDLFAATGRRATFFFLGRIGQTAPHLVRRAADSGHEIGCHSLLHRRITLQTREQFRADLRTAKRTLEDAGGKGVSGFRAPDFSIRESNRWAFDELVDAGFLYDSSVVPTQVHDVYGMTGVPEMAFRWPNGLIEFPLPVMRVLGLSLPVGGGGYFRLYPTWVTERHFRKRLARGMPAVFYIHPYEVGPVAPRLAGLSLARRFRHYVRLKSGASRLGPILRRLPFDTMAKVLQGAGYMAGTS